MNKMKKFGLKVLAVTLVASMSLPLTAFAAPEVKNENNGMVPIGYDEAVYVTMDPYGNRQKLSVVKGVDLNGNKTFTDYGNYKTVQNMSGYAKPKMTNEGVEWDLGEDYTSNRMYFEAVPEVDNIEVPWSIEVTYKLNGVPTKAEDLAGKSGLIETNTHCIPNPNASAYSKSNMMLQMINLVDTEQVLSVDTPGAQTQSLGKFKAILFAALPGEDITFTTRIGTEDFSSLGQIFMMEPATLSQMNQLKELRAVTETLGDTPALLLKGMGSLLSSVDGIAGSLSDAGNGLADLRTAYAGIKDYSADIIGSKTPELILLFSELSKNISEMMPYISETSDTVKKLSEIFGKLETQASADISAMTVAQAKEHLGQINQTISEAQTEVKNAKSSVSKAEQLANRADASATGSEKISEYDSQTDAILNQLKELFDKYSGQLGDLTGSVGRILEVLGNIGEIVSVATSTEAVEQYAKLAEGISGLTTNAVEAGKNLSSIMQIAGSLLAQITLEVAAAGSDLSNGVNKVLDGLEDAAKNSGDVSQATKELQGVGTTIQNSIDKVLSGLNDKVGNLLQIDTSAKKVSFTSSQNLSPSSVQIILRTETIGISLAKEDLSTRDESAKTPWERVKKVFKKIVDAVKTLFK